MRIDLNGMWKVTHDLGVQSKAGKPGYSDAGWPGVPVPGHWQQAADLRGHTGRALYRRTFQWEGTPASGEAVRLVMERVFYETKVWLNGAFLGEHTGYFLPQHYDITRHLRYGENVVMAEVDSPPEPDRNNQRTVTGLFHQWEGKPPGADPGGIWGDVYLEAFQGAVPEDLILRAEPNLTGSAAQVSFELELSAPAEGQLSWSVAIAPETFEGEPLTLSGRQSLRKGRNQLQASVSLPNPRLWWTWDHGSADLYRFALELQVGGGQPVRLERLFGVRSVEWKGSRFHLNGWPLFVRGAALLPPDVWPAAVPASRYREDLTLLRQANMNLARVYAHVAAPALYEEASRQGILLWQDFPLQGIYARSVLPETRRQAAAMVRILGHWPAVGLWCGHADPLRPVDANDPGVLDRSLNLLARLTGNWNTSGLAPAVTEAVRSADPTRPVVAHPLEVGEPIQLGWQEGKVEDLERHLKLFGGRAKFVTGFGAQSFPVPENSARFVRGTWPNLNWSDLAQRHLLQPRLMERHVPHTLAQTFEQYAGATQWYQSHHAKYVIEQLRKRKYQPCGGMVYALFADWAPGVTASLVDYWREPKPAYRTVQEAFRPVCILADWPQPGYAPGARIVLRVYLINDTYKEISGTWNWAIEREGKVLAAGTREARLGADQVVTIGAGVDWTVPGGLQPGTAELVLALDLQGEAPVTNRYSFGLLPPEQTGN